MFVSVDILGRCCMMEEKVWLLIVSYGYIEMMSVYRGD